MDREINFDDVEFGEPIEEREPTYRDGYIRGIHRAKNIIDSKQQEIKRLNNIINELNCGIKELDNMFYETFRISQNGYYSISEWELKDFTNKLQELKGSDKE